MCNFQAWVRDSLGRHAAALAVWVGLAGPLPAQSPAGAPGPAAEPSAAAWPMDQVKLLGGKQLSGLIRSEQEATIELVEIRRRPGKPTSLLVRTIDRREIVSWQRLDEAGRRDLQERIEQYKNRAQIEGRRMADLTLGASRRERSVQWDYRGAWFSLRSTADETTTRRSIVRLEQVLSGYRQILPPRTRPSRPFEITIFGSSDEYREFLRGLGLEIGNPAFFAADFNHVVAGSDINRFMDSLARVRRQNQQARARYETELAASPERLRKLSDELKAGGLSDAERQTVLTVEQKKLDEQRRKLDAQLAQAERANAARHEEVTAQMAARLYHEAFHAYLQNYVYPQRDFDVPRWSNEGLAQIFEGGLIEADGLRVDAPNPRALAQLHADLSGPTPLPLADLLSADGSNFLSAHRARPGELSKLYLYAWALAYYLTFEQPLVGSAAFDQYVQPASAALPPISRFERLVGMPLERFEPRWRKAMLALKP